MINTTLFTHSVLLKSKKKQELIPIVIIKALYQSMKGITP